MIISHLLQHASFLIIRLVCCVSCLLLLLLFICVACYLYLYYVLWIIIIIIFIIRICRIQFTLTSLMLYVLISSFIRCFLRCLICFHLCVCTCSLEWIRYLLSFNHTTTITRFILDLRSTSWNNSLRMLLMLVVGLVFRLFDYFFLIGGGLVFILSACCGCWYCWLWCVIEVNFGNFFIRPIESFISPKHILHVYILFWIFTRVLNECVVSIINNIFDIKHIPNSFKHILLAFPASIDKRLIRKSESLGYCCEDHLYWYYEGLR